MEIVRAIVKVAQEANGTIAFVLCLLQPLSLILSLTLPLLFGLVFYDTVVYFINDCSVTSWVFAPGEAKVAYFLGLEYEKL